MALKHNKLAITAAALAASAMTAMPSAAAELPTISSAPASAYDSSAEDASNYRYRRHRHRRGGIDAGDVIAGVVVLGAIAAIASSTSNNRSRDRDRVRDRDADRNVRYRETDRQDRRWSSNGIDNAVNMCIDQVERGNDQVESVDNAARDASGWRVAGSMDNGEYFTCRIDNEGRIRSVDLGDDFSGVERSNAPALAAGPQLSDQAYAQARAATRYQDVESSVDSDLGNDPRPAYPGGPLPGEEGYEESLGG